jgi:N-acetylglucosaminyl-diphospho-decaprenol L-rhamnosyltransferase
MTHTDATVSVVVPHAGNTEYLEQCLASAQEETSVAEVVLVMPPGLGGSSAAMNAAPAARALLTEKLVGYGVAVNRGASDAAGTFIYVLNDDTVISPGAIDALVEYLRSHPEAAACASPLIFPDGRAQPNVFGDLGIRSAVEAALAPLLRGPLHRLRHHPRSSFPAEPQQVDWLSGAALLVRKADFDAMSGFDEGFGHGLEDADLCRRLRESGRQVVAVPAPPIIHAKGGSGYRSPDPARVQRSLEAGMAGWCRYSRRYHGPVRRRVQQVALLAFVGSRLTFYACRGLVRGRPDTAMLEAYRAAGSQLLRDAW